MSFTINKSTNKSKDEIKALLTKLCDENDVVIEFSSEYSGNFNKYVTNGTFNITDNSLTINVKTPMIVPDQPIESMLNEMIDKYL